MRIFTDYSGAVVVRRDDGRWHTLVFEPEGDPWEAPMEAPDDEEMAEMTPWGPMPDGWTCPNPDDPTGCYCPGDQHLP